MKRIIHSARIAAALLIGGLFGTSIGIDENCRAQGEPPRPGVVGRLDMGYGVGRGWPGYPSGYGSGYGLGAPGAVIYWRPFERNEASSFGNGVMYNGMFNHGYGSSHFYARPYGQHYNPYVSGPYAPYAELEY